MNKRKLLGFMFDKSATSLKMPLAKAKFGFTLAEVLITLGIIGVVSAITIPTLMSKYREKQTVARLTETYSILSQAIRSVQDDEGTPDEWNLSGNYYQKDDSEVIAQKLLPAMKVALDCGTAPNDSCFYSGAYKYLNGNGAGRYGGDKIYKIVLMNGTSMAIAHWSDSERIDFYVDTNGNRPPNVIGRDMFCISWFKNKGLYPLGAPSTGYENQCTKTSSGWGCPYWVLHNKNLDYLK